MDSLVLKITHTIERYWERPALVIEDKQYSYADLGVAVSAIRSIVTQEKYESQQLFGLTTHNCLTTYASIIALWLEGKAYVPLSSTTPLEKNQSIVFQTGIQTILGSCDFNRHIGEACVIDTASLPAAPLNLLPKKVAESELAYIIFTSGTTGLPKGVPITRANLNSFLNALDKTGVSLGPEDRCLQMFELTFDFSVVSYLWPFTKGACIYTIPKDRIKYEYIYYLLDKYKLSVLFLVPSVLQFFKPYLEEIDFSHVRYSLFCGEALYMEQVEAWSQCMPNMDIVNFYGPTECTVFCSRYAYNRIGSHKGRNGILSIGTPMEGTEILLLDEAGVPVEGEMAIGELCLASPQLTPGYWQDVDKNAESFFIHNTPAGGNKRFYRTGDLCAVDVAGDIYYMGRADFQVKIQGFRVELSEIVFHCKAFGLPFNCMALPFESRTGILEIGLAFETAPFRVVPLLTYLRQHLPAYMIPTRVIFEPAFPLTRNGKTDLEFLKKKLLSDE